MVESHLDHLDFIRDFGGRGVESIPDGWLMTFFFLATFFWGFMSRGRVFILRLTNDGIHPTFWPSIQSIH